MYNSHDKSFYNSHSNRSSKPYEYRRWNHNSYYDQPQFEQDLKYKYDEKSEKYKKQRRFQNDNIMVSDTVDTGPQKGKQPAENEKWFHDKYEEVSGNSHTEKVASSDNNPDKTQKPNKRERKPDRQLYSVRGKRTQQDEPKGGKQEDVTRKNSEDLIRREINKEIAGIEKEVHNNEDDTKSYISNVSTSVSDPFKVGEEDLSKDNINVSAQKKSEEGIKKEFTEGEILFEIVLDSNKREHLKIYDNEEDYEGFLDAVCTRHDLGKRMSLYFKINILTKIQKVHREPQRVTESLEKLLDLNYKVIMMEDGNGIMDEALVPYFEDSEDKSLENALEEVEDGNMELKETNMI